MFDAGQGPQGRAGCGRSPHLRGYIGPAAVPRPRRRRVELRRALGLLCGAAGRVRRPDNQAEHHRRRGPLRTDMASERGREHRPSTQPPPTLTQGWSGPLFMDWFYARVGGMNPRSVHAEVLSVGVPSSCDRADGAGGSARELASDLGLSEATIYRWVAREEVDRGERPGLRSGEHIELSRARVRIKELEAELELTREASALFDEGEDRPAPKGSTR